VTAAIALLAAVTLSRLAELMYARRNTRLLMEKGAVEAARGHYKFIVALHALWLGSLWHGGWNNPVQPVWFATFLVLQIFRIWILTTLGRRWTTRIIVLPGAPLVANGPYRFFRHPNYLLVCAEIAVLPLCLGLVWHALVFSLANAMILSVRVTAENRALKTGRTQSSSPVP
jgi:methyltransferase